jgi:hypothetical protein
MKVFENGDSAFIRLGKLTFSDYLAEVEDSKVFKGAGTFHFSMMHYFVVAEECCNQAAIHCEHQGNPKPGSKY